MPDDAIHAEQLLTEFKVLTDKLDGSPEEHLGVRLIEVNDALGSSISDFLKSLDLTEGTEKNAFKAREPR